MAHTSALAATVPTMINLPDCSDFVLHFARSDGKWGMIHDTVTVLAANEVGPMITSKNTEGWELRKIEFF